MFTIQAHGIPPFIAPEGPYFGQGLSEAQYRLLADPCPIRVCGAPTGSGKTYAFLKAAHLHQLVIFVVPTQALAQDVEDSAKEMPIPVARLDGMQGAAPRQEGCSPWQERERQFEELAQSGGLLVTRHSKPWARSS